MSLHVTLETVLCAEGLLAAIAGTEEGPLTRVGPDMGLQVVAGSKSFSTAVMVTPEWLLSGMSPNVLPQITERREVLAAAF